MVERTDLKWLLERQLSWISAADGKIAVLGPVILAMLAISLSDRIASPHPVGLVDLPLVSSTITLFIALFFIKLTLTPRLLGPPGSNIFFGEIAKRKFASFQEILKVYSPEDFDDDLISQIHRNAEIANYKHKCVRAIIFWLAIATPLWLTALFIGG